MTITVYPCKIRQMNANVSPDSLVYLIGDEAVTSFSLTTQQDPDCGYPVKYNLPENLPDFITFNHFQSDFTISSDQASDAGSYTVTVKA